MFKEKGEVSTINKVLIVILAIISVFAVAIILLLQLNKKSIDTDVKETEGMIVNYATTEENTWDVSANGDGSVTATLSEDGTLTISGTGNMKDWEWNDTTGWHDSEIKTMIKNVVINEEVTSVGNYAFRGCTNLTDIIIPNGITSIGKSAFYGCTSLTKITIPEGVTSIGDSVFSECSSLTSINIPEGVTSIGEDAFSQCSSLKCIEVDEKNLQYMDDNGVLYTKDRTKIINYPSKKEDSEYTILEGVTSIEEMAFYKCSNLTDIIISNDVNTIGKYAFYHCTNLTNISIPSSVTRIEEYAFDRCDSITNINIPEGVTSLEDCAIFQCSRLKTVTIPSTVTSIGKGVFNYCDALEQIEVNENNSEYVDDEGILYTKDKTRLIKYPAQKKALEYTILEGVTSIESMAFYSCSNLANITIPESVTSIGTYAFKGCSSLTSINIPEGVTSIGNYTFSGCRSIISINIPESVTSIGNDAFTDCSKLTNINISSNVESIGKRAFYGCKVTKLVNKGEEILLPDILQRAQNEEDILYSSKELLLTNCTMEGTKIIINENSTYAKINVQAGALEGLSYQIAYNEWDISENGDGSIIAKLSEDGILDISGTGKMKDWTSGNTPEWTKAGVNAIIKRVNINNGITNIGKYAFYYCSNLESITIPEGVTSIGECAFWECSNLTSINIPEGVTIIGDQAFSRCSSLTEIKVDENNKNYIDDKGVLYTKDKIRIIKYPTKKEDVTYTILEGVTNIDHYTFDGCSNLTSIEIPEGVTKIEDSAFSKCISLTNITIPNGVTSIGRSSFSDCTSLTSITIPSGLTSIEDYTFSGCSALTSMKIPEGVKSIGNSAFSRCSNLAIVEIPSSVADIEIIAFDGCRSLVEIKVDENNAQYIDDNGVLYTKDKKTLIKVPARKEDKKYTIIEGVTKIDSGAFEECSNLISINIPQGVTKIGSSAFEGCSSLTSIKIPEGVTSIENMTFYRCSNLTGITIPNTVTSIGSWAFNGCTSLTRIIIPSNIIEIGNAAFYSCNILNVICQSNSVAHNYVLKNNIRFILDDNAPTIEISTNGRTNPTKQVNSTITAQDTVAGVVDESLKYLWSTESENITKEQILNSFQNGETLNLKDVTGTYYLWIYAKDKLGNESIVKSEVFVLDNTAPTAQVSYSTTTKTNQSVEVIITANEEIQEVEGWMLSEDKKVLTKEYTKNTTEIITVKDIAENETTVEIKVTQIIKIFKENTYKVKINYITGIQPKTTYENFVKNIETNSEYKVTEDNQEVTGNTLIKTGQKLTIGDQTFTLVVIGDCNGDGQANIKDILAINKHRLNKAQLVNEYLLAGDINEDGKVDLRDILQINKYRLGKISEL